MNELWSCYIVRKLHKKNLTQQLINAKKILLKDTISTGHEARKQDDIFFWYELQANQTNVKGLIKILQKFPTNAHKLFLVQGWNESRILTYKWG